MGYLRRYLAGLAGGPLLAAALIGLGLNVSLAPAASAQESENPSDLAYVQGQLNKILEFERTAAVVPWKNPETGNGGNVRLLRTYYLEPEEPCRDYVRTIEKDGKELLSIRGTGCRDKEGKWKLNEDSKPKRTVSRSPSAGSPDAKAAAKGAAGKPTDLKPDAKAAAKDAAAKEAAAKEAAAKAEKAKAEAAKPPPPPQIPVRLPQRTEEWEAGSEDG